MPSGGYWGHSTGTSAVPQIADDFGAPRKSVAVGTAKAEYSRPVKPTLG